jgi:hypothetical protein
MICLSLKRINETAPLKHGKLSIILMVCFFFYHTFFWIRLSLNGSNIKYDEIIYINSERTNILVYESLDLS